MLTFPLNLDRKSETLDPCMTVELQFNNLRYNNIPSKMANNHLPSIVIAKCLEQNPGITIFSITRVWVIRELKTGELRVESCRVGMSSM